MSARPEDERIILVHLDTAVSNTSTPYDSSFTLDDVAVLSQVQRLRVSLQAMYFPNAVYPINEYYDKVYWKETGGLEYVAQIPHNDYDGFEFAAALKTAMDAASPATFTVQYDEQSKKISVEVDAFFFHFLDGAQNVNREMGMYDDNLTEFKTIQIGNGLVNISGTKFIDVTSSVYTGSISKGLTPSVLARVPVNVNFGQEVYYESQTDDLLTVSSPELNEVRFTLYDDRGNIWKLPENAHVSLTFKAAVTPKTNVEGEKYQEDDTRYARFIIER